VPEALRVGDVSLEVFTRGSASADRLLFLHDLDYLNNVAYPFVATLSETRQLLSPSHPGFGASALPEDFDSVEDLACVYLDLLEATGPADVVGAGFGGWIAAEMAVRCTHHTRSLTLVDALGIKVSDRTTADIQDLFVLSPAELLELCWHDSSVGKSHMPLPASSGIDEDTLTVLLSNRNTAALLGWNPFMHNPRLRRRLARINVPTLVIWGASDQLVSPSYGRVFAESIPQATFVEVESAGHFPYLEQPETFVHTLTTFLDQTR
jgi:pimeloyl-ACP methyl ester carboxylesterase